MRCEMKYWRDTKNVDVRLVPETNAEIALLALVRDREPRWSEGTHGDDSQEIIFEPKEPK